MASKHVVVHGRVQGVSFRAHAEQRAGEVGVGGWVRNRDDGTVEMLVEGDDAAVDAMLDWARSGPASAEVTGVDVDDAEPQGSAGFAQV